MKECIMVDLEGTLSDSRWRQQFLDDKDYDKWNNGLFRDKPNKYVCALVKDLAETYDIIITTAKPEKYRTQVKEWLEGNCPEIPIAEIMMRTEPIAKWPSPQVKGLMATEIGKMGFEIVMGIDDRDDVMEALANEGVATINAKTLWTPEPEDLTPLKPKKRATVAGLMKEAGKLFKSRNKEYGSSYLSFGKLCDATFPDGLTIKGVKSWTRFGVIFQQLIKTTRIAQTFSRTGKAHLDSCRDAGVYSFMLEEVETNFQMEEDD